MSQGAFSSLNCSYSVGDEPTHVDQNLARIADYFGLPPHGLVTVAQVHGAHVLDATARRIRSAESQAQADALYGTHSDCAICVRTADCIPVLVGCRVTGAAVAIHAGWRGLVAGVISAAIDRLLCSQGARPEALVAAIGPHIGVSAFEVSPEVASALENAALGADAVNAPGGARPHVRLAAVAIAQLHAKGLGSTQIDDLELCTFSNDREFFSYRRDGKISGRQLSGILPLACEAEDRSAEQQRKLTFVSKEGDESK